MVRKRKHLQRQNSSEDSKILNQLISSLHRHKRKCTNDAPQWRRLMKYFYLILAIRISSVFFTWTEFVPDEAWQSTEVAYYYVFGRGHLTWEWRTGLRSHVYPVFIAGIYSLLKFFGADTPYSLVVIPRLFQATITAVGEYFFFLFCIKRYGQKSALWCLGCVLTCWFTYYCGSRTITNTTEMALNCIAMYLLEMEHMVALCGIVGLNFVIRPTALVIWVPQMLPILKQFFPITIPGRLPACILIGLGIITGGSVVDYLLIKQPIVSWWRFIKFNFIEGHSAQFGEHHVLWYFYSGIPSIVGLNLIILLLSLYLHLHQEEWKIVVGFIFCFSLVRHKEIRFLLPVLPYVFAIMGNTLSKCHDFAKHLEQEVYKMEKVNVRRLFENFVILCLVTHVLAGAYFCGFHQGAIYPLTQFINNASHNVTNPQIWLMTSCYSVPVFTYLHNPSATFEYMTCGPKGMGLEDHMPNFERYSTNSTHLQSFLEEKNGTGVPFPDFVLCFDEISTKLVHAFREFGREYQICKSYPHAQFGDDRGLVSVLCLG